MVQVCSKSSSFLLENSFFWAHTGPGAQPGVQLQGSRSVLKTAHFFLRAASFRSTQVQVCIKSSSFLLENRIFWVHTGPGAPPEVTGLY